jgi:aryl-alcohol dehydrogenase-like predicted oxidoreductase
VPPLNRITRKPGVDAVIIGARNEQQLRDNLAAASSSHGISHFQFAY